MNNKRLDYLLLYGTILVVLVSGIYAVWNISQQDFQGAIVHLQQIVILFLMFLYAGDKPHDNIYK